MADEDLEMLARSSASTRQLVVMVLLAIVLGIGAGWFLAAVVGASDRVIAGGVLGALVVAMAIAMRVPTPAHRFPTIRVLRDRAADVAFIVVINQHKYVIALAGRDGEVLAKPLTLKGTARMPSVQAGKAIATAQSDQVSRALQIITRRCPTARTAQIRAFFGLSSFRRLARKAIAALPPAS